MMLRILAQPVGLAAIACLTACQGPAPSPIVATLEPMTITVQSRTGGVVEEVFAKAGDHVAAGTPLVRLRPPAVAQRAELDRLLAAAKAASSPGQIVASLPAPLRAMLVDSHPDVVQAENQYVEALRAREAGAPSERLDRAASERVAVRSRISRLVSSGDAGASPLVQFLEARRRELAAVGDGVVRSDRAGSVDLLDLSAGDRVAPGGAVALVVAADAYSAEFELPAGVALPSAGATGKARLGAQVVDWTVESIHRRPIPPGLREDRAVSHRVAVRARLASAPGVVPGARAEFLWSGM